MLPNGALRRPPVFAPRTGSAVLGRAAASSQPIGGAHIRTPSSAARAFVSHTRTLSASSSTQPATHHSRQGTETVLRRRTLSVSGSGPLPGDSGAHDVSAAGSQSRNVVAARVSASTPQQTGRVASASDLRAIEARVTRLEENSQSSSGGGASQESAFSASESQRSELTLLGRNASGGPSAPPEPKGHEASTIKLHFRRLVYLGYGGVKTGAELVRQPYPDRGSWPKHPPSRIDDEEEADDAGLTSGNQIRLHLIRPYRDPVNQGQLRKTFRFMLSHRKQCGVPPEMSPEELVASCASTFKGWVREYTQSLTASGQKKKQESQSRARLSASRKRKAGGRSKALRLHRYCYFADGSKVAKPSKKQGPVEAANVRRGAVRADLEFAVQLYAMATRKTNRQRPTSPTKPAGPMMVSAMSLVEKLEQLEKQRARVRKPAKPILPPTRQATVPLNFTLPSTIRRWMVAKSWAEANKDACLDVSDNAGPFQGKYSVTTGPKEWGPDPDWELKEETGANRNDRDEDEDEDLDLLGNGDEDEDEDFDLPGFGNDAEKGDEDDEQDNEDDEEDDELLPDL
ncbi:hypothetical protein CF336_g8409 [Tilletia laevis]|nr:hypothetical protein CF336_g8409 [Tilletia laevis]